MHEWEHQWSKVKIEKGEITKKFQYSGSFFDFIFVVN